MAIQAPRRVKSQQTRKKIFDAAAKLLREHGEEYLTIANICETAGVSKGTFFYHFNSKDDLMLYYLEEGLDTFIEEHDSSIVEEAGDDVCLLIWRLYHQYLDYCQQTGIEFISNYYQTSNKALDARSTMGTAETMNNMLRTCTEGLRRAQANGYVRKDWSAEDMSFDCCSVVKGCVFEWCLSGGAINLLAHAQHILYCYFANIVTEAHRERFGLEEPPMA